MLASAVRVQLSEWERAVLELLAEGRLETDIAERLGLSDATLQRIVRALKIKLGAPPVFVLGTPAPQLRIGPWASVVAAPHQVLVAGEGKPSRD